MIDDLTDLLRFFKEVKDEYTPESKAIIFHKVGQQLMPDMIHAQQRIELAKYIATTENATAGDILQKVQDLVEEEEREYYERQARL